MKVKLLIYELKVRLIEIVKYDLGRLSMIPTLLSFFTALVLAKILGQKHKAITLYSLAFRTNWHHTDKYAKILFRLLFAKKENIETEIELILPIALSSMKLDIKKQRFIEDPTKLFECNFIVIRKPNANIKGIIIVKYSYYFLLLFKLFDVKKIAERYHLVLEPSWAGFFDFSLFAYLSLDSPVFVMTYEKKDKDLLQYIDTNLIPIDIGPNWWVELNKFSPNSKIRDIDVVFIASWSNFKRHYFLFKALSKVKRIVPNLSVALLGYNGDLGLTKILDMADYFGIRENITVYEKVPPDDVADILSRSKVNILWSRFEGNNRSIIEGFFCDTPAIIRKNHNFGYHYPYINKMTGIYSDEKNLSENILATLRGEFVFSPREYVMENHNYIIATELIVKHTSKFETSSSSTCEEDNFVAHKVNRLRGMEYLNANRSMFSEDYSFIKSLIRKKG